jgi:hypothetical protein
VPIDPELEPLANAIAEADQKVRPHLSYEPHANGQQQFHASKHRLRALFPGNRFGKTTAVGNEAQWQIERKERSIILWICPQFRTFELLQPQLEDEIFGPVPYNRADNFYEWPNRSRMYVIPRERDWHFVEGINPDLVVIDEECPLPLFRELRARGAGRNETRYVISATATDMSGSWMEQEIYRVWLEFHNAKGMDESQAMRAQLHPEFWVWPRGGIGDNPSMTPDKVRYFRGLTWSSAKEKKVRDEGGFETAIGDPVFDPEGIEHLRIMLAKYSDGENGSLEPDRRMGQRPGVVERRGVRLNGSGTH